MKKAFSIITPVFNRRVEVIQSIESSLRLIRTLKEDAEIVVIDDASTDNTYEHIISNFSEEISQKKIRVFKLSSNIGPTGAKQYGVSQSLGEWLIFMDSDDLFSEFGIVDSYKKLSSTLKDFPIVFFRCIGSKDSKLLGSPQRDTIYLNLKSFLHYGTPGECLPVVRKDCLIENPFNQELKGFESFTYAKIIKEYGPCVVYPNILRIYRNDENFNRLSHKINHMARGCVMARGHFLYIVNFYSILQLRVILILIKILYHLINCLVFNLKKILNK